MAAASDAIWVSTGSPKVVRIDPATNQIAGEVPIEVSGGPGSVAVGPSGVWVSLDSPQPEARGLALIDPATNTVRATVPVPLGIDWIVTDATSLWFVSIDDASVTRIDLAS
jgi:hypothetical protein